MFNQKQKHRWSHSSCEAPIFGAIKVCRRPPQRKLGAWTIDVPLLRSPQISIYHWLGANKKDQGPHCLGGGGTKWAGWPNWERPLSFQQRRETIYAKGRGPTPPPPTGEVIPRQLRSDRTPCQLPHPPPSPANSPGGSYGDGANDIGVGQTT